MARFVLCARGVLHGVWRAPWPRNPVLVCGVVPPAVVACKLLCVLAAPRVAPLLRVRCRFLVQHRRGNGHAEMCWVAENVCVRVPVGRGRV